MQNWWSPLTLNPKPHRKRRESPRREEDLYLVLLHLLGLVLVHHLGDGDVVAHGESAGYVAGVCISRELKRQWRWRSRAGNSCNGIEARAATKRHLIPEPRLHGFQTQMTGVIPASAASTAKPEAEGCIPKPSLHPIGNIRAIIYRNHALYFSNSAASIETGVLMYGGAQDVRLQ